MMTDHEGTVRWISGIVTRSVGLLDGVCNMVRTTFGLEAERLQARGEATTPSRNSDNTEGRPRRNRRLFDQAYN